MKININKKDILNSIGIEFKDDKDYFVYMQELREILNSLESD